MSDNQARQEQSSYPSAVEVKRCVAEKMLDNIPAGTPMSPSDGDKLLEIWMSEAVFSVPEPRGMLLAYEDRSVLYIELRGGEGTTAHDIYVIQPIDWEEFLVRCIKNLGDLVQSLREDVRLAGLKAMKVTGQGARLEH